VTETKGDPTGIGGAVTFSVPALVDVMEAVVGPKVTWLMVPKFAPRIVTAVPPVAGPTDGEILHITGFELYV